MNTQITAVLDLYAPGWGFSSDFLFYVVQRGNETRYVGLAEIVWC